MDNKDKLIAKNAFLLYIRMFITIVISFYTSRIVLKALGATDYGIYTLVGGLIVLVNMFSNSLNTSTSRFIVYALGTKNFVKLQKTFNSAFIMHVALSVFFILIAETVGLWFVNTQLEIPYERMGAANWVYQSATLSTVFSITQTPYSACITSHERFDIFAYFSIFFSIAKLAIALLALYSYQDHLIVYSILYTLVSLCSMAFYRFFCIRNFQECRIKWLWDLKEIQNMLTFSGWSLLESVSLTVRQQGTTIIINRFFGVLINAAAGIALQVQGIFYAFIGNITSAFSPQITKEYANGNWDRVNKLIILGTISTAILSLIMAIPIVINMDFLMSLWLEKVPLGSVVICQIIIFCCYFNCYNTYLGCAIKASGKIKYANISMSVMQMLTLILTYFAARLTKSYEIVYIVGLIFFPLYILSYTICLKYIMPKFRAMYFMLRLWFPITLIGVVTLLIVNWLKAYIDNLFLFLAISILTSLVIVVVLVAVIVLNKSQRYFLFSYTKNKLFGVSLKTKL